jgi:type II secretory pathway pseudopilin PulG
MTIALAIMGLLGALALPSLTRLADRTSFSLNRQDVERQLDALPQIAASQGRNLVLTSTDDTPVGGDPYPLKLPSGWRITVDAPIRYRYDGTCGGGKLRVTSDSSVADYVMKPPLCELRPG